MKQQHHKPQDDTQTKRWQTMAACRGKTHLMFPQHHKDITYILEAREICAHCTVRPQCLKEALEYHPIDMHGVWAGLTSRQLAAKQKELGIKPKRPSISQMWDNQ